MRSQGSCSMSMLRVGGDDGIESMVWLQRVATVGSRSCHRRSVSKRTEQSEGWKSFTYGAHSGWVVSMLGSNASSSVAGEGRLSLI